MLLRVVGELSSWSFENDPLNLTNPKDLGAWLNSQSYYHKKQVVHMEVSIWA